MNTGRKILSETPTETREMFTSHTAELMQRTVPLIWYSPEWKIPEAQNEIDIALYLVDIIIAHHEQSEAGYFDTNTNSFCREDGTVIDTQEVDFWAYMPKHPNK